jgi:redox-sensitive bicupin YhaK (pirin superfamily)
MATKEKQVQQVLTPPPPHMVGDGFRVHNFFPSGYDMGMHRMSPFFMLDYNSKVDFSPRENPRGVGVHPHRGFETVTIAYHGKVAHHDSAGNSGIISEGEVQWMTAASGVLHKEYHEKEFSKKGGPFQMVQLWVNLPAKDKMSKPKYQGISKDKISTYTLPDNGGVAEVIAGEFKGVKGAASTFTPLHVYNLRLNKGADNFVLFKNDGETITVKANENCLLLVLSDEPINEPIVPYGPFVMNTKEEIKQAYDDFNNGKFGVLEE